MLHNALCFDAATTVVSSLNRIFAIQNKLNENRKTNANGKNTFFKIFVLCRNLTFDQVF